MVEDMAPFFASLDVFAVDVRSSISGGLLYDLWMKADGERSAEEDEKGKN
jgi:hypothetical protein